MSKLTQFLQTKTGFALYMVVTVALGFMCLEGAVRLFAVPVSYDFIERRIQEQGLTPVKERDEYRIFLFGESTMHGHIYYPESTIARWMELYFQELLDPDEARKVKVYNFGRLGAVSDFMFDSFRETLAYKPDLVVFYTAHNDFCIGWEWPSYRARRPLGEKFTDFMRALSRKSVFIGMFRRMSTHARLERRKNEPPKEVKDKGWYVRISLKQLFDEKDLLYKGSEEFRKIESNWKNNIREIMRIAGKRDIDVIFFKGVSNYKYFEPFKSVNDKNLTGEKLFQWRDFYIKGEAAFKDKHYRRAIDFYEQALTLDQQFAQIYYRMGQSYEALKEYDTAKKYYFLANEYDRFPIRAPGEVNEFFAQLAEENRKGVYVIETPKVFEEVSPNGIVDSTAIIDAVHPNIYGQSMMAKAIVEKVYNYHMLPFTAEWKWASLPSWEEMFKKIQWTDERLFESYCELATYVGSYYEPAVGYMEKAVAIRPQSVYARTLLAWLYWKTGRTEKALDMFVSVYKEGAPVPDGFKEHYSELYRQIVQWAQQ